ncbi:hypothetical protein FXF62_09375 [Streptococcus cristatus]|uniref:Beta-carotene 15,15'-monooxygenase n=1 Tax=Streptococcus cristatus TaxID=45634 RepID=A0A5B0DBP3_STRCR|nr:hypothetical protein [Streptococcus cristatus]KAA0963362.1 hypothetical protein FXF62_09375 [Streptococcus cristatus]
MTRILNFLNSIVDKFNEDYEQYKSREENLKNLKVLKILNNTIYIEQKAWKDIGKYACYGIFYGFLLFVFSICRPSYDNIGHSWLNLLWPIMYLFILICLIFRSYYILLMLSIQCISLFIRKDFFRKKRFLNIIITTFPELFWLKHYFLLLPIFAFSIMISYFIPIPVTKNNYTLICISILIATRMMTWILKRITHSQPRFLFGDYTSSPTIILAILGILGLILGGVNLEKNYFWSLTFIIVTISSHGIKVVIDELYIEGCHKAQRILEVELLSIKPNYDKLKECYFYGGEKYKEKLLSTEKFLEVIVKNELKSLKDLKTYDDYMLYKVYKGRSYL